MEIYLEELEHAIQSGNTVVASEIAKILAEEKSNVTLKINEPLSSPDLPEKIINVKVVSEDRLITGVNINLKLKSSMTFGELKLLMFERFEFPPSVQKWIIGGKRLAKDADTLHGCRICKDGDVMHLYLVSARSVGLTKEIVEEQYGRMLNNGNSTRRNLSQALNVTHSDHLPDIQPNPAPTFQSTTATDYNQVKPVLHVGWSCPTCTYMNDPTRPGCVVCSTSRPCDYVIPENYVPSATEQERIDQERIIEEMAVQEREENFQHLLAAEQNSLVPNSDSFECRVCFEDVNPGDGVILRECLHSFCRECLMNQVLHADSSVVFCPFNDGQYQCFSPLQDREIKALVTKDLYQKHLNLSLVEAESRISNSFHCRTPNCVGWCIYDDDSNEFTCPLCFKENCLTCKAIHEDVSCKDYQNDIKIKSKNDHAARKTQEKIERMLTKGNAMKCPTCDVIVMKKDGCDWIRCTMCKTEICWVTKGARWGPQGSGDTSGGCQCGLNNKPCHPNCQNCH